MPTILVNRRETRFYEDEYSSSKDVGDQDVQRPHQLSNDWQTQVDVSGLEIAVISTPVLPTSLKKPKASDETKEILVDSHLRLKAGIRYGLVGRNGTGKSSEWKCFGAWDFAFIYRLCTCNGVMPFIQLTNL
jgi:hypothetical protein